MKQLFFRFLIVCVVLDGISCKEYLFENPVDPRQTIVEPTDLQFVAVSETLLVVKWNNNNLSTNYPNTSLSVDLESSLNGISYSSLTPLSHDQTSASVKGPFQTDKSYYVRARFKTSSAASQYSNAAQFVIQFPAPTNLAAVQSSDTLVTLSWRDNSSFETGFLIERGTDSLSLKVIDSTLFGATTKAVRGNYVSGLTYYFRVRAKSVYNYSSYSSTAASSLTLNAPSNLTASAVADTAMTLGWKINSTFETGFLIERSSDGTNYTVVDSVGANVVTKSIAGKYLVGTTYYFRVRAKSAANYSGYSNTASTTLTFPAPSSLTVTSVSEISVGLQWIDNSAFENGFVIERSTDGASFALVDSVSANVTTKLLPVVYLTTTTYSFRVRAKATNNYSLYSNTATATLAFDSPSGLTLLSVTDTAITLRWTDNSTFETGFLIERSTDGVSFALVDSVDANVTTKSVAGVYQIGTTYSFRIRAKSAKNYSGYSNITTATITFPAPSNLLVTSISATSANLQWTDNSTFETGFIIERSTDGVSFAVVDNVGANVTTKSVAGVYVGNTTYSFRVRAQSAYNVSAYSNIAAGSFFIRDASMVNVSGGTYQMGSNDANGGASPLHSVTLGSFYMDKTEITFEKWTDVLNWGFAHGYTDLPDGTNGYEGTTNHPVINVNWYDVLKWCNARSEKDGLTPIYYTTNTLSTIYKTGQVDLEADAVKWTANGYRLPTEAEWEFAAQGGTKSHGYIYSGSNTTDDVAWYRSNSGYNTHAVSTRGANELGIYDMSGNAWEWCWDWYGAYLSAGQTDPKGPTTGSDRVLRGGSFADVSSQCRVVSRLQNEPFDVGFAFGFRCVQK